MRTMLFTAMALSAAMYAPAIQPGLGAQRVSDPVLEARLYPPHLGQVPIRLNQPAYVALFEVVPGAGVSLVSPRHGTGFTAARESWIELRYNPQRWIYRTQSASYRHMSSARYFGNSPFGATQPLEPPRYLFLVASLDPIDVEQFQGSGMGLRQHLGVHFASYRPYDVMEQLAYALLPYTSNDRWVSDVIADWGYDWGTGYGGGATAASMTWLPVVCRDGSLRYAPFFFGWGYGALPCQPASTGTPPGSGFFPPGTTPPPAPAPGDSAGEGRDREVNPGPGRTRTTLVEADEQRRGELSDEQRALITELREDAARSRFGERLGERLRSTVTERQRASGMTGGTTVRDADSFEPARFTEPRVGPARTETPRVERPRAEPTRTETPRVERPRPEPTRTETPRVERPRPEPSRTETPRVERPRPEPTRTETPRVERTRVEPTRTETPRTESPRSETPRSEPSRGQGRAPRSEPVPASSRSAGQQPTRSSEGPPSRGSASSGRSRVPPPDAQT